MKRLLTADEVQEMLSISSHAMLTLISVCNFPRSSAVKNTVKNEKVLLWNSQQILKWSQVKGKVLKRVRRSKGVRV